jgi:hypothetical protein
MMHRYGVALSGQPLRPAARPVDEQGSEPFEEAVQWISRWWARCPWDPPRRYRVAGPHFVGAGASLVYLAEGEVLRIELLPPASG